MPKVKAGESQKDWMGRCMPVVKDEGATQEQAVGKCLGMYRHATENVIEKIDKILEAVVVADVGMRSSVPFAKDKSVETSTKGKGKGVERQCPEGQRWCAKCMDCIDIKEAPKTGIPAFQCPGCEETFYTRGYSAGVGGRVGGVSNLASIGRTG